MYTLKASQLAKRFGARKVFSDIDFQLHTGQSLAVVGPNGSGKSTLLKVLVSLLRPARGRVEYAEDGRPMDETTIRNRLSFVAPYLNLYDHLTAEENLRFFCTVGGHRVTGKEINGLLAGVGLEGRGHDLVDGYSSGMKQRLKYAVALLGDPDFLFLDEPGSNLDEQGREMIRALIEKRRQSSIVVIATNEPQEVGLAEQICRLGG
ncbi:MAG: ABC transporter ATP-binding protein [Candidatus Zixiibacteriota bacterium]|nr:MAG: ABC transporter ATP-binding protein [candidate division Zixibacteria bacterium]